MKKSLKTLAVLSLVVTAMFARGQVSVYDSITTPTSFQFPMSNNVVIGQQVFMDPGLLGANPFLRTFSFVYYSTNVGWSGSVMANIQFYQNSGSPFNGYATPSPLFYETGSFALANPQQAFSTNAVMLTFAWQDIYLNYNYDLAGGGAAVPMSLGMALPSTFTMVYTFSGLTGADTLSLPVYNTPVVGTNYNDYWVNNGSWALVTNTAGGVSFGAQFNNEATPAPEPSVLGLGALGMVLMAHLINKRRK